MVCTSPCDLVTPWRLLPPKHRQGNDIGCAGAKFFASVLVRSSWLAELDIGGVWVSGACLQNLGLWARRTELFEDARETV